MKEKMLFAAAVLFSLFLFPCSAADQGKEQQSPKPKPSPAQSNIAQSSTAKIQEKSSPWLVEVASIERVKAGRENEPHVNPGEMILKVGIKFRFRGPDGDISTPVLKVTEGSGKEHIMIGKLQSSGGFDCFQWLLSASHVILGEKPQTLASTKVAKCQDVVFHYYFILPENPKEPLALVFGDAKPLSLVLK